MSVHDHGIIGYVTKNAADETYTDADGARMTTAALIAALQELAARARLIGWRRNG